MGKLILILFALLLLLCFCIYNCWFQHEKSKRMFENEKKNISVFNTSAAWAIYSVVIFLAIVLIAGYEIYNLVIQVKKMSASM
jgi:hypothetical protein